jgi:hypothetical protein
MEPVQPWKHPPLVQPWLRGQLPVRQVPPQPSPAPQAFPAQVGAQVVVVVVVVGAGVVGGTRVVVVGATGTPQSVMHVVPWQTSPTGQPVVPWPHG